MSQTLERRAIRLVSLQENISTTTVTGRCFLSIIGAIYQMERELRAERAAAKARGRSGRTLFSYLLKRKQQRTNKL
jgi:DNA invertase Pin-like site-specific DNA recombinase